jgi:hypothetical protein
VLYGVAASINFIVFGLNQAEFEPLTYQTSKLTITSMRQLDVSEEMEYFRL